MRLELPRTRQHIANAVELRGVDLGSESLAMFRAQPWLRVKRVNLRHASVHEQQDYTSGARGKMRHFRCCLARQDRTQSEPAEPMGRTREQFAARHMPGHVFATARRSLRAPAQFI